ncbi:MAG: transporter substrate-binding domain-containing protein [Rubritepida sp.]|nr:transporter substrate-binding domain-containing protein [Rubritepida sp.]
MPLGRRHALGALALLAAAPARADGPPRAILAPTGTLRVAVYPGSPTSLVRDARTGEARGLSVDLGTEVARRLGVPVKLRSFTRVPEVIAAIAAGEADLTISNATPARAREVDFSETVVSLELGFLVPAAAAARSAAEVDAAGMRIGAVTGSTTERTLPGQLRAARVVAVANLGAGRAALAAGELDAFATNKAILFEMSDQLPGARVLDGRWGLEHLAFAVPKGRGAALPWLSAFAAEARASGLLAEAIARAGLRGVAG